MLVKSNNLMRDFEENKILKKGAKFMDKKYFGGWYVICGRNFGLDVTHEEGSFMRASKGPI